MVPHLKNWKMIKTCDDDLDDDAAADDDVHELHQNMAANVAIS